MTVTRKIVSAMVLIGIALLALEAYNHTPPPVCCDFAQMAYQSPEFIDSYLGGRQHSTGMEKMNINGTLVPLKTLMFWGEGNNDRVPFICVLFYKSKAIEIMVWFNQPHSSDETLRRVGLKLSAFRPISNNDHTMIYKGYYRGINFQKLQLDNVGTISPHVSATFSIPEASKG